MSAVVEYAMKMKDLMSGPLGKIGGSYRAVTNEATRATNAASAFSRIGAAAFNVLNIVGVVKGAVGAFKEFTDANQAQQEAETKLAQVMRNTMGASDAEIQSIKDLTAAQQQLGIVGDEIQLAGAQELGTYLEKTESLKSLIPVMNDMVAQQYGYNATQENAVNIATMMGKVMEGQVGALSRYGYKFDEAQEQILKYGTEAQKVATLTEVIGDSVGGMNAAMAQTPEGRMKQLKNTLGDIKEQIGNEATKLGVAMLPAIQGLMPVVQKVMGALSKGLEAITPVLQNLLGKAVKGVTWIVDRIGGIKPYIAALWQPLSKIFDACGEKMSGLTRYLEPLRNFIDSMWAALVRMWTRIGDAFSGLLDFLDPIIEVITGTIMPIVNQVFDVVTGIVGDIIEFVSQSELLKDIFSFIGKICEWIGEVIKKVVDVIKWIWDNVLKPILNGIEMAYRLIKRGSTEAVGKTKTAAAPVIDTKKAPETTTDKKIAEIAKNTRQNAQVAKAAASGVASSGPKVVNINVQKFFDNIQFNTTTLQESAAKIEDTILEVLSRVLVQGASAT